MKPLHLKQPRILKSLTYSIRGLYYAISSQRNMKIHLSVAIVVIIGGLSFHISKIEWILLLFSIVLVVITECINTAIEIAIDLSTRKVKLRAMLSKDVAAGAVLLSVINAIIIGYLIFYDKFVTLLVGGN